MREGMPLIFCWKVVFAKHPNEYAPEKNHAASWECHPAYTFSKEPDLRFLTFWSVSGQQG